MDDVSSLILGEQKPKYSVKDVQNMVYGQESSFGKADTSKANDAGAVGPMQVTMPTFEGLKKKGLIPKEYDINNPKHNKEAGNALIADAYNRYEGDADKVLAEYYGGPKAISKTGEIATEMRDLKNSKAPTVGQYIQQAKSKLQPLDEVSNLILGGQELEQEEKPKGFIAELKKPLSEMSWEGFKKESLLSPAVQYTAASLGLPGFTQEDKKPAEEKVKSFAKSVQKVANMPIQEFSQNVMSAGKNLIEHPGQAIGEAIKGTIYDPELAVIPGGAVAKPIEKGIAKAGVVAKELGEQFAKKEPAMAGVGAAEVGAIKNRVERAKELPIPIDLSKDQATRNPADVRFARETAKDPVLGQPLQEKYAADNAKIQQNLDKFIENTGAEFTGAGEAEIGKMLSDTISKAKMARKGEIKPAYNAAREAGQMNELLDVKPMTAFIEDNFSASKNAPIISSINSEIKRLSKGGQISINDLEEVRKMAVVLSQSSGPDAFYGRKAIKLMDQMTEGKGGNLYKEARRINTEYMKEFENTPVIRDITAMKLGTTQRAVAIENLVDKSLISSPGENVKQLFASLEKIGAEGQAITKELRGAVAQRIKDEATKGVQLDINGKSYVSTKALNDIIKKLDKSGKLEFIFGKKVAEHYRTLNEVTKDLQTVPQGTTNPSGTASSILAALGEMGVQTAVSGVPVPVVAIGKHLYGKHQTKKKLTKINEFVNYGKEQ